MGKYILRVARRLWLALPEPLRQSDMARKLESFLRRHFDLNYGFLHENGACVHGESTKDSGKAVQRVVSTLEQLDNVMKELAEAEAVSDDELRRAFNTFSMKFPWKLPADPFSQEYRDKQLCFYQWLHGKPYTTKNEVTRFDVESAAVSPFPFYTQSPQTVGNHIIAIGHLIRTLNLAPNSSVLEFGPGWGNVTVWLARMGYRVTAVDIEEHFVRLIQERARRKGLNIEAIQGDFQLVNQVNRKWDAVIFFECFHHCVDHHSLIAGLSKVVSPGGKVLFAAEPITDAFPMPWGFRTDGESLWAIRKNGWCELGFQETYFRELLERYGWHIEKYICKETPWGTIFVATREEEFSEEETLDVISS